MHCHKPPGQPNHARLIIVMWNFWKSLPNSPKNIIEKMKKTMKKVASLIIPVKKGAV